MVQNYKDAARTLKQSTLGYSKSDINGLLNFSSTEAWISHQASLSPTQWTQLFDAAVSNGLNNSISFMSSWMKMSVEHEDILRQKIAYTLSQLFVISTKDRVLSPMKRNFCLYFDGLMESAFGNFRDLLYFISRSPMMGEYLTFLNNESGENTTPDENYARELLQLFALGTTKLYNDGKPVLDEQGQEVQMYSQKDIEELARVFTGWTLTSTYPYRNEQYSVPMEANGNHDIDQKQIMGRTFPANIDAETELLAVIELLMEQDTLYTYISKYFINKWVTSNPSGSYVERVRNTFKNSNGDMKELVTAILTDTEAKQQHSESGRLRDPNSVFIHAMKAFNVVRRPGVEEWAPEFTYWNKHHPFSAPSVFYHYKPSDAPSDPAFNELVAPEFKVYTWNSLYNIGAQMDVLVLRDEHSGKDYYMSNDLLQLFVEFRDVEFVDKLDELLFDYEMPSYDRNAYLEVMQTITSRSSTTSYHVGILMNAILSPAFTTQV
jgi:uncharacterized protein (DUF1800 family)